MRWSARAYIFLSHDHSRNPIVGLQGSKCKKAIGEPMTICSSKTSFTPRTCTIRHVGVALIWTRGSLEKSRDKHYGFVRSLCQTHTADGSGKPTSFNNCMGVSDKSSIRKVSAAATAPSNTLCDFPTAWTLRWLAQPVLQAFSLETL